MAGNQKRGSPNRTGRLARLTLKNVRCFREVSVDLDPRVTVLIGENGSGKTTVIEALASLTYGEGEGLTEFPLAKGARSGEIALFEQGEEDGPEKQVALWTSGGKRVRRRRLPEDRYLFAYGRYRRVFFAEPERSVEEGSVPALGLTELSARASRERTTTLFRPNNHLLRDLARYLGLMHKRRQSEAHLEGTWGRLEAFLRDLDQGVSGIEMEPKGLDYVPRIIRHGIPLELRELSDGYQALLVILFDLALRYSFLPSNPEDPLSGEALVAIDEVDLHLHPRWQRMVTRQLTSLFPNTQFVLTTHSPAVVQGAIDEEHRVLALHQGDEGVVVRPLKPRERAGLEGAEIGSILQEEKLFGVDSRYSMGYQKLEKEVRRLSRRASRRSLTDEERARLLRSFDTLKKLMVADEKRRADGSFLSQIAALRLDFLHALADQIAKAKA